MQPVAGDHYTVRQAASTVREPETRSTDQRDSGHYSVGHHARPQADTHDTPAEDSCPMGTTGVVRLLRPTRVPSGYQKMVWARSKGRVEGVLWMFEPVTQGSPCQLADAILNGNGGACQTLIIQNLGTEEVHLKPGTILGSVTVSPARTPRWCRARKRVAPRVKHFTISNPKCVPW